MINKLLCHLVIFELILTMFLRSHSYDFDVIAHAGALLGRITVLNSIKIEWTVLRNLKISLEGREKKYTRA